MARGLALALTAAFLAIATVSCSTPSETGAEPGEGGLADVSTDPDGDGAPDAPADAPHDAPVDVKPPGGTPLWEDLPFQVAGCTVQRLANAAELKLFNWQPCSGLDGCSEAVWHPEIISPDTEVGRRTTTVDDGQLVRVGVAFGDNTTGQEGAVLTLEDGTILLGLRTSTAGGICHMNIPTLGGGRFGVNVLHLLSDAGPLREGGILAPLSDLTTLTPFEIDPLPPGTGPDETAMGTSRWLWRFAPDQLTTFSNVDGSSFAIFAKTSPSILLLAWPTSTGPSFLFNVVESGDGGKAEAYIGRSDGVAPLERFLSGSPTFWVGAPMFAHSHIGWLKGVNPKDLNVFDAVELWASPYSEDASQLAPYKVGDLIAKSWSNMGAGWGRCVTTGKPEEPVLHELLVWEFVEKTSRSFVLPPDRYYNGVPGLTRSALWILAKVVASPKRGLMRFDL